jgi:hypothetical protein
MTLAGQTQKFGLELQKSDKSERVSTLEDVVTPFQYFSVDFSILK